MSASQIILLRNFREEKSYPSFTDVLVACDCFPFEEVQSFCNCPEISVALINVGVSSGQMGSDKAETGVVVVESNANPPFVSRYSP